jgi:lipopolysaccharide exporter
MSRAAGSSPPGGSPPGATERAAAVAEEPSGVGVDRSSAVLAGTRWIAASNVIVQVVRLGVHVVLARMLPPSAFGLLAMALVVTSFLDILRDLGTRTAIVQKREVSERFLSSMFFFNLAVGMALTLFVALAAPLAGWIYRDPDVTGVLRVMGLAIVLASLGLVQQGLLQRHLLFGRLSATQYASAAAHAVVSLGLAAAGFGVWALVGGVIASTAGSTLAAWLLSSWRPRMQFRLADVREVWSFSLNLSGSQIFSFLVTSADKFILGRAVGAGPLGFYVLAQRLIAYPIQSITHVLQGVLFPAFSRAQDENAALRRGFVRACAGIALIIFPAMSGAAVVADPLVRSVLGPEWLPVIPLIVIMAPIGALQAVNYSVTLIYQAKGRTDLLLGWSVFSGTLIVGAYIVGLAWGVIGVVAAYAVAIVLLTPLAYILPFRLIDMRWRDFVAALLPYVAASSVMIAVVLGLQWVLGTASADELTVLLASVATGVLVYAGILLFWRPPALTDLGRLLLPRRRHASEGVAE